MYKKITLILSLLLLIGAVGCQQLNKDKSNVFYGTAEIEQIAISAETTGIIKEIKVSEGDSIAKDTLIAVISTPESSLRAEQAALGVQGASNELQRVNEGARAEEIAVQSAMVKQAEAQLIAANSAIKQAQEAVKQVELLYKQAEINSSTAQETYNFKKKTYEDTLILYQDNSASKQELDAAEYNMNIAKNAYENSKAAVEVANTQLSSSKAQLEVQQAQRESLKQQLEAARQKLLILVNGAAKTSKTAAELGIKQAETNYELSKLNLEKTEIKSNVEGVVNTVNYRVGEYVLPGSAIATITNSKNVWVKIYVPEKLLPQLKLKQEVLIKSDMIDGNIKGVIANISSEAEYTPMNIITKNDRERLVYAVKVQIVDNYDDLKAGMLLDVQLK